MQEPYVPGRGVLVGAYRDDERGMMPIYVMLSNSTPTSPTTPGARRLLPPTPGADARPLRRSPNSNLEEAAAAGGSVIYDADSANRDKDGQDNIRTVNGHGNPSPAPPVSAPPNPVAPAPQLSPSDSSRAVMRSSSGNNNSSGSTHLQDQHLRKDGPPGVRKAPHEEESFLWRFLSCACFVSRRRGVSGRKRASDDTASLSHEADQRIESDEEHGTASVELSPIEVPSPSPSIAAAFANSSARLIQDEYGEWFYQVTQDALLPPPTKRDSARKTLVLDLDETLVHSTFSPVPSADFVVPLKLDRNIHNVYVSKRPGVDAFLRRCSELFEVVVFTASLSIYANPVIDQLDKDKLIRIRLFREACVAYGKVFVKDMRKMGRSMDNIMIIDNIPTSYCFTEDNGIPIITWTHEQDDQELARLLPFLEDIAKAKTGIEVLRQRTRYGI